MKFRYVRHEVMASAATPDGVVYRPRVPIQICGPKAHLRVAGLIDTGADQVFLSTSIAELIGISLGEPEDAGAEAADGSPISLWPVCLEIELSQGNELLRWNVNVGFISVENDEPTAVYLGQAGFLEFFDTMFYGAERSVELVPNDSFPGGVG